MLVGRVVVAVWSARWCGKSACNCEEWRVEVLGDSVIGKSMVVELMGTRLFMQHWLNTSCRCGLGVDAPGSASVMHPSE